MAKKRKNGEGTWGEKKINGTTYKFYRDKNLKYTYGKTISEVKQKLENKTSPLNIDNSHITFGEYIMEWLNINKSSIEDTTLNSYEDAITTRLINYKKYDLANVEMTSLNSKMFQDYLNSLAENYSLNSIKKTWGLIKSCITFAEIKKDIEPLHLKELVRTPSEAKVANKKREITAPTVEEVQLIYKELKRKNSNGKNRYGNAAYVIMLIMYTGLRVSEAIGLKWSNVDFDKNEIIIDQSLARIREVDDAGNTFYQYKSKTVKTKQSKRSIPLPERAKEAIFYFEKYKKAKDGFVCVNNKNHNHYTRRQIERTLERVVKNSDCIIKSYTPHILRHGYGSILLSKGVDIKIVSELLGHEDVSFTYNVYIDIFKNDKQEAVKVLN